MLGDLWFTACDEFIEIKIITAQKMKFSIKDSFGKCSQIRRKLRIWSHLLKKSLMVNFIFCAVYLVFFLLVSLTESPQTILNKYRYALFKDLLSNTRQNLHRHYSNKEEHCIHQEYLTKATRFTSLLIPMPILSLTFCKT